MGIGLLGPLQIDGSDVRLGRRDRIVLSVLALSVGEPVSTDRLTDAVWGGHPPASAQKNLQGCVVRLRRLLGPAAIETTAGGYRLAATPDQLDIGQVERGVERARELMELRQHDQAAFLAEETRQSWRGTPLSDLESWELADSERAHLEELRLDVEEIAVEALLGAGRCAEAVPRARELAEAAPLREQRWILLARAQYQASGQAGALATLRGVRARLREDLGLDPGPQLVALERAILRQDPLLDAPSDTLPEDAACPYRGLAPYDPEDSECYFGRRTDVSTCLATVHLGATVAVVGPSGSGKSSLLRAGLTPVLREEGRQVTLLVPGADPGRAAARIPVPTAGAVLVVDQLEELFSVSSPSDRRAFVGAVRTFREKGGTVVLGLRADRLAELTAYPWLAREVERGVHLLADPDGAALRAMITEPARRAGLHIEPGLVELLVREMALEPGVLPLLSHCLLETWKRREGRTLTVAGYEESGGVRGAVRQSAEAVYAELRPDQRQLLRELLLRLVAPRERVGVVRRRVPLHTIAYDDSHRLLVDRLVTARLVTVSEGEAEIAHEALSQAWPRLRAWLDEDVEGLRIQHHLTSTAEGWDELGRPRSELYRGIRLARARAWWEAARPRLSSTELAFFDASLRLVGEEEWSTRETVRVQRANIRRLRVALSAGGILLVLALVAGFLALGQAQQAERATRRAEAGELGARALAMPEPSLSLLLAAQAYRLLPGDASRANLQAVIAQRPELVASHHLGTEDLARLDVAPDGRSLLVQDRANRVWRLDLTSDRTERLDGPSAAERWAEGGWPVEFHPRQPWAVVGLQNLDTPALLLLDAPSLDPAGPRLTGLPTAAARASDVAVSADGRFLAAALQIWSRPTAFHIATAGRVLVWDLARGGDPVLRLRTPPEMSQYVAFSADGSRLFTSLPLTSYDVATGEVLRREQAGHWLGLEINPSGRLLAHPDTRAVGGVVLRSARTLAVVARLAGGGQARALRFSHDGTQLAVAGSEGRIIVWDPTTRQRRAVLAADDPSLLGLGFSPDDNLLYSSGAHGAVRVWDLRGDRRYVSRAVDTEPLRVQVGTRALSPRGDVVASVETAWTAADAPWLRFLDLRTGRLTPAAPLEGVVGPETGAAWSPDGSAYAVAGRAGLLQIWDPGTGALDFATDLGVRWISGLDFDPAGRRLLFASQDGLVGAVDAATGRAGPTLDLGGPVCCVAAVGGGLAVALLGGRDHDSEYVVPTTGWALVDLPQGRVLHRQPAPLDHALTLDVSPDGERVAFGGRDGRVLLARVDDGTALRPAARGHEDMILSVDFSDDGRRLVSAGTDGTVRVWDGRTGRPGDATAISSASQTTAWFQPGKADVVVTTFDEGVLRWPTAGRRALEFACDAAGRELSAVEWRQYLGDRPYDETCG